MTFYVARIEVHQTPTDYTEIHNLMAQYGLFRTVLSMQGVLYRLPTGTYSVESDLDTRQIIDLANAVVTSLGKTAEILVVKSADTWFFNLPRA